MRLIRSVYRNPVAVFGLFVLAFGGWVLVDSFRKPEPKFVEVNPYDYQLIGIEAPPLNGLPPRPEEKPCAPPQATAEAIRKLKPGMTRTEVEVLVGAPAANDIHPASVNDGRVTYHTTYETDQDLDPPATVRPIHTPRPAAKDPNPRGKAIVKLEFDATKPGHPLVSVQFPVPMF